MITSSCNSKELLLLPSILQISYVIYAAVSMSTLSLAIVTICLDGTSDNILLLVLLMSSPGPLCSMISLYDPSCNSNQLSTPMLSSTTSVSISMNPNTMNSSYIMVQPSSQCCSPSTVESGKGLPSLSFYMTSQMCCYSRSEYMLIIGIGIKHSLIYCLYLMYSSGSIVGSSFYLCG